ncbi:CTD small phosphatase-like protein 2 [Camellia lanceoleosa]|uniref:CTD small phosphatase-like protein 2 n=1 Tax=Camellia lanceoleosa TaxID=1840588 RepID=A0ACC0GPM2_9ERIC|nr:CTD small phosphatase-like protein 2 [Camellia lanceoleosa]
MPSLKMKTKSTVGCLREKNGLHVCQKSNMISKNSCSNVRISHQTAEFDSIIQNSENVSLCNKVYAQEIEDDKAIDHHELIDEENVELNSATAGRMESTPPTCASNLETIFSPTLESNEVHGEPEINNDAGLPIEGNSIYDDITEASCLLDYKCDEPSTFFDVAEEYMILPFLEDTMEAGGDQDGRTCEDTIIDSDDSSLYLAIHQLRSCNEEPDVNPYSDSDQLECFDPHMFIRNLPDLPDVAPNFHPTTLLNETQKMKSTTLVLDLDETLVHSTLEHCEDADFSFPVFFNMKEHTVYVKQRPYLQMFLERVAEMFEIVVFTASQSIYAEQLLDILDPDRKLISRRAYRESCIFSDGSYTKDLTVLGVDLAKIAIIDNSPQVMRTSVLDLLPIAVSNRYAVLNCYSFYRNFCTKTNIIPCYI